MIGKKTILFVDDEIVLHALVGAALEDEGFAVVCAKSGADALKVLQRGEAFDFVVSDVSMPDGVSGVDLAHHVQALLPGTRVILASGHPKAQLDPFPASVAFLAKPYRLGQLLALMEAG